MSAFPQTIFRGWTPPGTHTIARPPKRERLRTAFYTRYSTASQFETSTERQIGDCQAYSKRLGLALVEDGVYSDEERSGGYMVNRERLHALLETAQSGELDVVVIADPTRLSRDMVDLGWLWRRLARAGVALHAASRGPLAAADIALYGFLSQEQRQTIATNTAWGRKRMVSEGRVPWGAFYGYRKVEGADRGGEIEIDPDQARVVARIYELRLQGISLRGIAGFLNREGIEAPRSESWTTGAVYTVLNQPCYAGTIVYGRYRCETDPDTGRTKHTARDRSEWIVAEAPRLKIIDPATWERAHAVNAKTAKERRGEKGPRGTYLLSNLLRCRACGNKMTVRGTKRGNEHQAFICSLNDHSDGCTVNGSLSLIACERAVFAALESFLSRPDLCRAYLEFVAEETNSSRNRARRARGDLTKKIASLRDRLLKTFDDAIITGFSSNTLSVLRGNIEKKLADMESKLEGMPKVGDDIDVERETAGLGTLHDALAGLRSNGVLDVRDVHGERLAVAIRALIDHVVATPIGETRGVEVTVSLRHPSAERTRETEGPPKTWEIAGSGFPPTRSEIWRRAGERQVKDARASGNCVLDDGTWLQIAHLVPEHHCRELRGDMRTPRALVDMLLLSARLSRPFSDLPADYGPRWRLRYAVRSLKASGDWKAVCDVLSAKAPRFLKGTISHHPHCEPAKPRGKVVTRPAQ